MLDVVEDVIGGELGDVAGDLDRLVDRNRPDGHRRRRDDRLTNRIDVAAGREVHHGIGAEVDGVVELLEFAVDIDSTAELPMLALIFTLATLPMAIGSSRCFR